MIEQALERIAYIRELQEGYIAGQTFLQRRDRDYKRGDGKLLSDLMQAELDEWRNLLMWALVADIDTQDRIKAAAHQRFLSERHAVAQWFNDGAYPSSWLKADENEFREMARKAFAPRKEDA